MRNEQGISYIEWNQEWKKLLFAKTFPAGLEWAITGAHAKYLILYCIVTFWVSTEYAKNDWQNKTVGKLK